MSALRLNYPGKPIELIPLGPARGRVTGPQITGGSMWDAIPVIKGRTTFNRAEVATKPPTPRSDWGRCGKWMPFAQEGCYRRPDHADKCATFGAVTRDSDRRRRTKR